MTQFDDREKAFESQFQRELELDFKIKAHRNKLLGLWASDVMGFDADAAEVYANEIVATDFEGPGDAVILNRVLGDLQEKGVETSEHLIQKQMDRLMSVAREEILEQI